MTKIFTCLLLVTTAAYARAEAPLSLPDEPLEGQRLEPELLSQIRDLLISDSVGGGKNVGVGVQSGSSASSSYGAPPPPPSNSYGAPSGSGGRGMSNSAGFAPPAPLSNGNFGGFGAAPKRSSSTGDITLSDPELAPLLKTFDLSPTVQQRSNSGGSNGGGFAPSPRASNLGNQGSGGY